MTAQCAEEPRAYGYRCDFCHFDKATQEFDGSFVCAECRAELVKRLELELNR